ncbi:DUF4919 domain-containing protein [Thalassomonas sp. M1454]|uniref:DUF4919 domain-containing protein n=1 Tax=Thalassomonas sp. M1454 TaxID=2594477 RepID=UPI00163D9210|nr:DUF4919 domain-containing protein [Thalassomonas sp. M1454]
MRFIILILSISIFGCSSNGSQEPVAQNNPTPSTQQSSKQSEQIKQADQVEHLEQVESSSYTQANEQYQGLLKKVKTTPNFEYVKALKLTYIHTEYYQPFMGKEAELIADMYSNIESKNWLACSDVSSKILATNYISLDAHYGAMACSFESNLVEQGKYHRTIMTHLLQAMWQSGDGLSPMSPLFCTSKSELYAFLKFSGFTLITQSLLEFEDKTYDVITVKDPDSNKEFELFFDISSQWQYGFKDIK